MTPTANTTKRPERGRRSRLSRIGLVVVMLVGLASLSLLVAACGGSASPGVAAIGTTTTSATSMSTSPAGSPHRNAPLAFSHCMRSHGVPNFPDPNSQGDFPPSHLQPGVSKQTAIAAQHACQHLLPNGGSTGTLQQDQLKLAFALKVARCLRAHGFPTLPDPTVSSRAGNDLAGAGIDPNSPRFQAAQTTCEKQAKQALALP